jgi:type II secretory pathway pseudopilin PulG
MFSPNRRRAFTLVELFVVVGIVSLLSGVLVPVVGKARAHARRGACRSQLHGVGMALRMYVDENRNLRQAAGGWSGFSFAGGG